MSITQVVTHHKKTVVLVFAVMTLVSAVLAMMVTINYNMEDYLPDDAPSTTAIDVMKQSFGEAAPNARVMLSDVTIQDTLSVKDAIRALPGVQDATWLDDVTGRPVLLSTPVDFFDASLVDLYYRDRQALISVSIASGEEVQAVESIRDLIGESNAIAGPAVNTAETADMAVSEVVKAIIILLPILLLILIVATTSWLEPLFFLMTIGVAVVINLGTTALFPDVSYLTQTVSPILQLAVSMDYAIFLLHSFNEYRLTYPPEQAMQLAMKRALPTVAASAATTMVGFASLMFMRFGIGSDLGIHLLIGIVLSFISVMIFLPALALLFAGWSDKLRHRRLIPDMAGVSRGLTRIRIPLMILALVITIPCFLAQRDTTYIYGNDTITDQSEAGADAARIDEVFGHENIIVLLIPRDNPGREVELAAALSEIRHVDRVVSYVTSVGAEIPVQFVDQSVQNQFYSDDFARMVLYLDVPEEGESTFAVVDQVRDLASARYETYYLAGQSASLDDMRMIVGVDTKMVSWIAIVGIFLVILLTFRSLSIPVFLVFSIQAAIWINLSIAYFSDQSLNFIGYLIISTVQLGATVDYAILLTNHYLQDRKKLPRRQAMQKTLTDNLAAILVSAGILSGAGFVLSATSSNPIIAELGTLLGRGTLLSFVSVVCVLPALLVMFDKVIAATTLQHGFHTVRHESGMKED